MLHNSKDSSNLSGIYKHAIILINKDREKHRLSPVRFSNNRAAQFHAEEMLRTKQLSHWNTNGMKPYMTYSIYGGTGSMSQNVSYISINKGPVDPYKSVDKSEYSMLYEDSESEWGHRDNILNKYHTHVSIGVAYDDFYFAYVQNFENNYIRFDKPVLKVDENNRKIVEISGTISASDNVENISIYYDEAPSRFVYEKHKEDHSYGLEKLIAIVVKPLPPNYYYLKSANFIVVEAIQWSVSSSYSYPTVHGAQRSINIRFDIFPLLKAHGVYTIVIYFRDMDNKVFSGSSFSLFTNKR